MTAVNSRQYDTRRNNFKYKNQSMTHWFGCFFFLVHTLTAVSNTFSKPVIFLAEHSTYASALTLRFIFLPSAGVKQTCSGSSRKSVFVAKKTILSFINFVTYVCSLAYQLEQWGNVAFDVVFPVPILYVRFHMTLFRQLRNKPKSSLSVNPKEN